MTTYPTLYNKNDFIKFLKKINVNEETIEKFTKLPNAVIKDDAKYKLNMMLTYNSGEETSYSFELNYYSKDLMEFLFNYKIFSEVNESIIYLVCELDKYGYAKKEDLL